MMDFSISNALICDDVRREMGGKDILVGVNGSRVHATSLPVMMSLCLWMEVIPTEPGLLVIEVRVLVGESGERGFELHVEVVETEPFAVFTSPSSIVLLESGIIAFQVRPAGTSEWRTARQVYVSVAPLPPELITAP